MRECGSSRCHTVEIQIRDESNKCSANICNENTCEMRMYIMYMCSYKLHT